MAAAPREGRGDSLAVLVQPVNENSLVHAIQTASNQTHSKHKEDQTYHGK
jgi:hypothetical protein